MSQTTYQRRKAAGVCVWCEATATPPHVYCDDCLLDLMQHKHGWVDKNTMRAYRARKTSPPPTTQIAHHTIAHCTGWHPITQIPWQCPVCQAVLLKETTA